MAGEARFNGFWWMVNLLQFLPDMTFTSRKAVHLPQKPEAVKIADFGGSGYSA